MKDEEIKEFIYYTQYQKKLPITYFFLTKECLIWSIIMYITFQMLNPLIAAFVMLISFAYVIREYFHYKTIEKYELPLIKKIKKLLLKENKLD